MDDNEFFDVLYQGWAKTTGAETTYWGFEPTQDLDLAGFQEMFAIDQNEHRTLIGYVGSEADAAWITALHGCFADLTRRLHEAVDDAERYDCEKDRVISEMAQVVIENEDLRERLKLYE